MVMTKSRIEDSCKLCVIKMLCILLYVLNTLMGDYTFILWKKITCKINLSIDCLLPCYFQINSEHMQSDCDENIADIFIVCCK